MGTRPVSGFASRVQTSPGIAECELQNRYQEQLACMQQLLDAKAAWKLMEDDGLKGVVQASSVALGARFRLLVSFQIRVAISVAMWRVVVLPICRTSLRYTK